MALYETKLHSWVLVASPAWYETISYTCISPRVSLAVKTDSCGELLRQLWYVWVQERVHLVSDTTVKMCTNHVVKRKYQGGSMPSIQRLTVCSKHNLLYLGMYVCT